jgi:parallel beta-helix repeat protein
MDTRAPSTTSTQSSVSLLNSRTVATSSFVTMLAAVTLTLAAYPAAAQKVDAHNMGTPIVSCSVDITAPGHYVLTADLACRIGESLHVTADNVDIDFQGFTLVGYAYFSSGLCDNYAQPDRWHLAQCGPGVTTTVHDGLRATCTAVKNLYLHDGKIVDFNVGIDLCAPQGTYGSGARIENMRVIGSTYTGILLAGYNNSQIINNFVSGIEVGAGIFAGDSHDNVFRGNIIAGNNTASQLYGSNGNSFTSNIMVENTAGLAVFGSNNDINKNTISDNRRTPIAPNPGGLLQGGIGIEIGVFGAADGNTVRDNTINDNTIGIQVHAMATHTSVRDNNALGNQTTDAFDETLGCGTSIWSGNTFKTKNQTCIQ